MVHRLPVLLLVLFFCSLVLGNEAEIEEKAKKWIRKNKVAKQVEESEDEVQDKRKVKRIIAEVQNDRKTKKGLKDMEKFIESGVNNLKEMKKAKVKSENTEQSISSRVNAIMQKEVSQTVVHIGDLNGNVVRVKLIDLERAGSSSGPIAEVRTANGAIVNVSTAKAKTISKQHMKKLHHFATAQVEQELFDRASTSQEDMDRLINLLFKRIVKDHDKISQRKAFSRVEDMMNLKQGTIYTQYKAGVEKPTVPEKQEASLLDKAAPEKAVYGIINNMDLIDEQEMPESVRLVLNQNLKKEKQKEEEAKNEKKTWKEFLFGK